MESGNENSDEQSAESSFEYLSKNDKDSEENNKIREKEITNKKQYGLLSLAEAKDNEKNKKEIEEKQYEPQDKNVDQESHHENMEVTKDQVSDNSKKAPEEDEVNKKKITMESDDENSDEQSAESSIDHEHEKSDNKETTEPQSEKQESKSEDEFKSLDQELFKKPVLIIGPRKGKPSSIRTIPIQKSELPLSASLESDQTTTQTSEFNNSGQKNTSDYKLPLSYKEPVWGSEPQGKYKIEVLKNGVILDTIDLTQKSFYVIGRLPVCDIPLAHPTISRYHAILQYGLEGDDKNIPGYYLYDLESTHGTFWNGCKIKPKMYVRLRGRHMVKFGCSRRQFIIHTPSNEVEDESEYSYTELKEMKRLKLLEKEKEEKLRLETEENLEKMKKEKEEAEGIDWGISEDADEESDLAENPYAMTNNEELFLDDPKKTLRGWFEREGYDLQYQTEEKGIGQFLCWVELPIDASSRTARAEALVKGKKKEAVIQCALEACRILDRHGLLRQATHEGRKRKSRNWEEEDYYDSDEDNFLDRTGTVERKRERRMRSAGKLEEKAETYTSLVEKHSVVIREITKIETTLKNHNDAKRSADSNSSIDALDAFMSNLSSAVLNKGDLMKLKIKLQKLKKDEENLRKLVNIAKPASLPALNPPSNVTTTKCTEKKISSPKRQRLHDLSKNDKDSEDNNKIREKEITNKKQYGLLSLAEAKDNEKNKKEIEEKQYEPQDKNVDQESHHENMEVTKDQVSDNSKKAPEEDEVNKKKITMESDDENSDEQSAESKKLPLSYKEPVWGSEPQGKYKIEVLKNGVTLDTIDLTQKSFYVIGRLPVCDIPLAHHTMSRYHAILQYGLEGDDKNDPGYYLYDLESTHGTFLNGCKIKPKIYVRLRGRHMVKFGCSRRQFIFHSPEEDKVNRKKKKNMHKIKQKAEKDMQKNEDGYRENYSTWLPPENQSGDGRTSLNEKFGY